MAKILVVDDESVPREITTRLLKEAGHNVTAVSSCAEALEAISYTGCRDSFEVVVMDYHLGKDNGLELAHDLGEQFGLPVVMVSGDLSALQDVVTPTMLEKWPTVIRLVGKPYSSPDQLLSAVAVVIE